MVELLLGCKFLHGLRVAGSVLGAGEDEASPQARTLNEIKAFAEQHGYPPTIKELAEILGISHASKRT